MGKRILLILAIAIFIILPLTSATFSFSNYKEFIPSINLSDRYGSVKLYDGNIIMPDKLVSSVKLTSNSDYCIQNCFAEGTITIYTQSKLIEDVKFRYDTKTSNYFSKDYKLYIQDGFKTEHLNEEICNFNITNSKKISCQNITINNSYPNWVLYNNSILNKGIYNWRIEGTKSATETIDWVGTWSGVKVTEWAVWGGVNYTDGDYTVHVYKDVGTWSFNYTGTNPLNVSVLVVAGGGGGSCGGGGAGGLIYNLSYYVQPNTNTSINVGVGGLGTAINLQGKNGTNSTFGLLNALGGGGGGFNGNSAGLKGGSGGGGGCSGSGNDNGGAGYSGQGYSGGYTLNFASPYPSGGGGGAGQMGGNTSSGVAGNGGNGLNISINGTWTYYAGGGGGGLFFSGTAGTGGLGGGGNGASASNRGSNGVNGTGGGGGGGGNGGAGGGNGGNGIVIVRYLTADGGETPSGISNSSSVSLISPANNTVTNNNITHSASLTSTGTWFMKNATLYVWNSSNSLIRTELNTTINGLNGTITINFTSYNYTPYDTYKWNVLLNTNSSSSWASSNYTLIISPFPEIYNNITGCTAITSSGIYKFKNDIYTANSSSGKRGCITLQADNVSIDGNGYTMYINSAVDFGILSDPADNGGNSADVYSYNITVKNINIKQTVANGVAVSSISDSISGNMNNTRWLNITINNTIEGISLSGYNSIGDNIVMDNITGANGPTWYFTCMFNFSMDNVKVINPRNATAHWYSVQTASHCSGDPTTPPSLYWRNLTYIFGNTTLTFRDFTFPSNQRHDLPWSALNVGNSNVTLNANISTGYGYTATMLETNLTIKFSNLNLANVTNISIYKNGLLCPSNVCNVTNWTTNDLTFNSIGAGAYTYQLTTNINTTISVSTNLISPQNNSVFNTSSVSFSANATVTNGNLSNMTLYLWNSTTIKNFTTKTGSFNISNWTQSGLNNGVYNWNVESCATNSTASLCGFANNNLTVQVNVQAPYFTINAQNSPRITTSLPSNLTAGVNSISPNIDKCWYNTSDNATIQFYTCDQIQVIKFYTGGTKTTYFYANDTFGNTNSTTITQDLYDLVITQSGSSTISEGSDANFTLSVVSTSFPLAYFGIENNDAYLWYNGTNKGYTTKTNVNANRVDYTYILPLTDIYGSPSGSNYSWFWSYTVYVMTPLYANTTAQTQTVYAIELGECGGAKNTKILNLTLRDEELTTLINTTSPNTAIIELDLSIVSRGTTPITTQYYNKWYNNQTVAVCITDGILNSSNFTIDFVASYESTDHVKEFYYLDNGTLSNSNNLNSHTLKDIELYDLETADSTTFLFEYTDANGLVIDDIIVHTFRKYIGDGVFKEVERSKQDNSGQTHVHLVEEDVIYYFMISKDSHVLFNSSTYNAKCLATPCEISLSASPTEVNWSEIFNEGGQYKSSTSKKARITNLTFNLDEVANINATLYKYVNGVLTAVNSSQTNASSGTLSLYAPLTYGNATYTLVVYKNGVYVNDFIVDLTETANDYFGTFGVLLAGLIVLSIVLMAVTEGVALVVFTGLALAVVSIMTLVDLGWLALVSILVAGGIIVWKLTNRRNRIE